MTNPIPLIITGANGRMGQALIRLIGGNQKYKLIAAAEQAQSPSLGNDAGVNAGTVEMGVKITESVLKCLSVEVLKLGRGVVIDFTTPQATMAHVEAASQNGLSMVIGTTGLSESQIVEVKNASKKIPIVLAPNMSVGMNLLFSLVADAAKVLGDTHDIEIFEAHHRLKKDAPSGSAVRIAQVLCEATGRTYPDDIRFQRQGMIGERGRKEIGIQTLRGGDIVGDHTVFFCGDGERVEIKHTATSRNTFAVGALRAAEWIVGKEAGLYSMKDVLGI